MRGEIALAGVIALAKVSSQRLPQIEKEKDHIFFLPPFLRRQCQVQKEGRERYNIMSSSEGLTNLTCFPSFLLLTFLAPLVRVMQFALGILDHSFCV